ncbi:MAG: hypothetical protein IPK16_31865 [Anaerolineales bacterium]|nr:hypothetical protein [Anaerolineales bacterium]
MFGEFTTGAIVFLLGAVTVILIYLAYIWFRNPVIAKLGLRNLARRPAQTVLIIIGLTLSTVIIISALGTGDTLRYSVQRQAVAAYGKVDEIIAPPLLSMLVSMANPNGDSEQAAATQATVDNLMKGGVDSVLALVQGGLPSISTERLERLRNAAGEEPLIDGVSGAVVFPTIIRNVATGQNEPLGFIYAVDDQYPQAFGLKSVNGQPLTMEQLEPGIGNIFLQATRLFDVVPALTAGMNELQAGAAASGVTPDAVAASLPEALAAIGALLTGIAPENLPNITVTLDTLDLLGINTAPLRSLGRTELSLRELAELIQAAAPGEILPGALPRPAR